MFKVVFAGLIVQKNISKTKAGELVGVSPQVINNWVTGKTEPGHRDLVRISQVFDVSIDSLLGNSRFEYNDAWVNIPVIDKIPPGHPRSFPEYHRHTIPMSSDIARLFEFGYLVQDKSMENAGILFLDIVFVQCDVPIEDGVIHLVVLDGREIIARIFIKSKCIMLKRESNGYKPLLIDTKKADFRIIGRITGLFRPDMHVYEDPEKK